MNPLDLFDDLQQWLFEGVVQPLMFHGGLGNLMADGFRATGWLIIGVLQIVVMVTLFRAFERWRPVEAVTDRASVRTDIGYTLIHRLGLLRVTLFFAIDPFWDWTAGQLHLHGVPTFELDRLWPGATDVAWISFVLYLLLFDFIDYWYHRAQHHVDWWWQLHAVHHSQQQMTLWTDNRNHLLDDVLRDSLFVVVALAVGVPPGQFVGLVALTQLIESFSHANVRLGFGPLRWLLVSPSYHRLHHAVGLGHESAGEGTLGGHNFAVLFPVWDLLFGTARFDPGYRPTGIRDQLEGRDYGRGILAQQWLGLQRLGLPRRIGRWGRLRHL
ncbi:sterol desaturase family protein [Ideonella sp. A 288]|uniref:sterol desaturase family protein n=1 Tax=Ideonella sp. A 288 TaxID=1962181 RepID=UPI000B4B34DD|nr:sterol desaturase family protein [Ideonella sp. A 288]